MAASMNEHDEGESPAPSPALDAGLTWRLVISIIAVLSLGVLGIAFYLPNAMRQSAIDTSYQSALQVADQVRTTRSYYNDAVIAKVVGRGGIVASEDHATNPAAIPLPATFVHDTARSRQSGAAVVTLTSPYPWPNRADRRMDSFQERAWEAFATNPDEPVALIETVDGKRIMRLAIADRFTSQNCVACHNSQPNSAKTDWKVGDVRAVMEVNRNIEAELQNVERRAWTIVVSIVVVACGVALALVAVARTVEAKTEEKRSADEQIFVMAHFDSLTGLHNRMSITSIIDKAIASNGGRGQGISIFFIDLDRFKEINDGLGHAAGDKLLKTVALRLLEVCGPNETVGRLGGDEFIIVETGSPGEAATRELASQIVETLAKPMTLGQHEVSISGSVGVMRGGMERTDRSSMMRAADTALYKAKAAGKNGFVVFDDTMNEEIKERRALEQMIRDGLDRGRFHLLFQPIVSARTGQLKGFESLLRMIDNDGRVISPKDFVPVAEDIGLITPIGTWALREACRTAGYWPESLTVAVNLSPAQFVALTTRDETISQVVAHVLAETGLAPGRLELEITEGLFLERSDIVLRELEALKALGVAIVLDDFGTGYSSLAYLWKFPFDKLKIDQSFVHLLTKGDVKMTSFVRTIASLGHTLNLKVTAEGIESYDQAAFVRALGVDSIQGFLFGRPRPSTELDEWILDPLQVIAIDLPYAETSPLVPDPVPPIFAAPPRPDPVAMAPSNSTRLTERAPTRAPYQPKPRALAPSSPSTEPRVDAEPAPAVEPAREAEDRPPPPPMTALQAATMGRYSGGVRVTVRPGTVRPAPSKV